MPISRVNGQAADRLKLSVRLGEPPRLFGVRKVEKSTFSTYHGGAADAFVLASIFELVQNRELG